MLPIYRLLLLLCLLPVGSKSQTAGRFDIVINELMADPSPAVGLPNSEYIELKNTSSNPISLKNWILGDGTSSATINVNFILEPDSFIVICPNSSATQFNSAIGVSNFPSLNNDGDVIILYSPEGTIIHAVEFSNTWYQNPIKRDGGWSLEMIDTRNPCGGISNWKASNDASGGTPGRKNSVDDYNRDELPPALIRTYSTDSITVVAVFDEPLDSARAAIVSNYTLDNNVGHPISATPFPPLYTEVKLEFSIPLSANTVYQLTASGICDCAGNIIGMLNKAPAGIPAAAERFDLVINEILFNPAPAGYDFLEIHNRGNKVVDLQSIYICNINASGNLTNIHSLSGKPKLLFPGSYVVFTGNAAWLRSNYVIKNESAVIELPALPSMPDDHEQIAIVTVHGERIDELHYDKKWHFALIDNEEGVSLERINYNDSTQNKNNWTSAASTAGFGTPGYQNSQFRADLFPQGQVLVAPGIFSPDNSGMDDFTTISCRLSEPGYVINITIFDQHGRVIRHLARNVTTGISAIFNWDGLTTGRRNYLLGITSY